VKTAEGFSIIYSYTQTTPGSTENRNDISGPELKFVLREKVK